MSKEKLTAELGNNVSSGVSNEGLWSIRLYPNNQPPILLGLGGYEDEAWEMAWKYYEALPDPWESPNYIGGGSLSE